MTTETKHLVRSRNNRMVSGLAAGVGAYMGIDPTVVRILFALAGIYFFP